MRTFSLCAAALAIIVVGFSLWSAQKSRAQLNNALTRYNDATTREQSAVQRLAYVCGFTDGRVLGHAEGGNQKLSGDLLEKANTNNCNKYRDADLFALIDRYRQKN